MAVIAHPLFVACLSILFCHYRAEAMPQPSWWLVSVKTLIWPNVPFCVMWSIHVRVDSGELVIWQMTFWLPPGHISSCIPTCVHSRPVCHSVSTEVVNSVSMHGWRWSQQTRNHFWTSWHMSCWFIIGTAPPVHVFMCIHMNTRVLSVVTSFEWIWHQSYWVRTGTVSLVRVITWKTRDFTVNTCRHTRFVHRILWIHVRKHVNWTSCTREFSYRTCEITGRCLLGWYWL